MGERVDAGDRLARGREARKRVPRSSHGEWEPAPGRRDPVEVLIEQGSRRVQDLPTIWHNFWRATT